MSVVGQTTMRRKEACNAVFTVMAASVCAIDRNNPTVVQLLKHIPIALIVLGLLAPEPNVGLLDCCNCLARYGFELKATLVDETCRIMHNIIREATA